jgi:hypothetical protein
MCVRRFTFIFRGEGLFLLLPDLFRFVVAREQGFSGMGALVSNVR